MPVQCGPIAAYLLGVGYFPATLRLMWGEQTDTFRAKCNLSSRPSESLSLYAWLELASRTLQSLLFSNEFSSYPLECRASRLPGEVLGHQTTSARLRPSLSLSAISVVHLVSTSYTIVFAYVFTPDYARIHVAQRIHIFTSLVNIRFDARKATPTHHYGNGLRHFNGKVELGCIFPTNTTSK